MIDWDDLRYFLAVHRQGSLARAAATLGINATTVGRRLQALEERFGARLFDRQREGHVLAPAGRALLAHAEQMEAEAHAVERELIGADARAEGVVRVSVTEMLATRFIAPRLHELAARHPGITIDLQCTMRPVSLVRRDADIVLRLARPEEPNLVTKRLADIVLGLYASAAYLERRGAPADAERSLRGHDVVAFAAARAFAVENDWLEPRLDGARLVLRSDSVSSLFGAVVGGVGIGLLPVVVAAAEPGLRRLATRTSPAPRVVWQTVHEDLQRSARVRAVLEFLGELIRPVDAPEMR